MNYKKMLLVLLVGLFSMGSLFASGDQESSSDGGKDKPVEINIMTRWTGSDSMAPILQEYKRIYSERNPDVKIIDNSIAEENAYNNKLKVAIASGDTPGIFYWPGVAGLVPWAENGVIMDLRPVIEEDKAWADGFVDGAFEIWNLEKYGVDGIYSIPNGFNPEVMFYNKALFEKAGAEVPETMDDLYDVIEKLKAIDVIPWGVGAKSNWRTGHIHNNLIYRTVGVDTVKDLGTRQAKWTDSEVVASLAEMKKLQSAGAFEDGFVGVDYNTEKVEFLNGNSAMICNGAWFLGDIKSSDSPYKDDFSLFAFPYFADKSEYKGDSVLFTASLTMSGTMEGAVKDKTIDFAKFMTGQEMQQLKMDMAGRFGANKNVTVDLDNNPQIMKEMMDHLSTITNPGGDYFDYDPNPAMLDVSRVSIVEMMINLSPEEAAAKIQKEVDSYEARQ